jgi:hypothetical protein
MGTRILVLAVLLSGCSRTGLYDLPDAPVRPVITQPFIDNANADVQGMWEEQVFLAAEAWNDALVEAGCEPMFRLANDGEVAYAVTLWTREEWPHDESKIGIIVSGDITDGRIDIQTRAPFNRTVFTLVHEFGHALGLEHVEDDADSVMTVKVSERSAPTRQDVAAVCP